MGEIVAAVGTRAPMPPICMPMEPTLAKPQRAKVAIEKVRGESVALSLPSSLKARNSLMIVRVPSRLPMTCAPRASGMPMRPRDGCADDSEDVVEGMRERDACPCAQAKLEMLSP